MPGNEADQRWLETPTLSIEPVPGGAFLRSGIYIAMETPRPDQWRDDHENYGRPDYDYGRELTLDLIRWM